jgi:hypothetical protein
MTIDNFDFFSDYLKVNGIDEENVWWRVQILKRKKENPEMKKNSSTVRTFFFSSSEEFELLKEKIMSVCEINNARAYIDLNGKNIRLVMHEVIDVANALIKTGQFRKSSGIFENAYGSLKVCHGKAKWLVDVDDNVTREMVAAFLANREIPHDTVNTPNGQHFIVPRFDKRNHPLGDTLKEDAPSIVYFKNNII